jgi:transcriptional regulator with AAA-type ATPase domain
MSSQHETLAREVSAGRQAVAPHLFLILVSDRPTVSSIRLSLRGVERVALGRIRGDGSSAGVYREEGGFRVEVNDSWISTTHATLRRIFGAWSIEDKGSKNGTLVNGRPIHRERLADGDLIEAGHTFFIFRDDLPSSREDAAIVDAASLRPAAAGLATLLPSLAASFRQVVAVAPSSIPVVIRGESGTGKEVIASALHTLSGRKGPFQPVNCGTLSSQAELFGHRHGAFPGAVEDSPGLIPAADTGTLFLDEIGDLSLPAQTLLLRALQDGEVLPVGVSRPMKVDVRVVAATHRDLDALAAENRFRSDLLARIAGLTLILPPLRQRREDLGLLISTFLRRRAENGVPVVFSCETLRAMLLYSWPLNVRELEKTVEAAVVLAENRPIELTDLPPALRTRAVPAPRLPASIGSPAEPEGTGQQLPDAPPNSGLQRFLDEVSRRHVVKVVVAYGIAVFGALQGADIIVTRLELPPQWMVWLVIASLVGLPVTAVLSWVFDITRAGIVRTRPLSAEHRPPARIRRRQRKIFALALCVLALLTVGGVLWWRSRLTREPERSSAVPPP